MRTAIVAGQFYSGEFKELENQIKESFENKLGPGALPVKRTDKEIKGIISAHAGYMFSGPAMAWGYKEIAESKFPDTYIILGLDHTGMGETCISDMDWETPLGIVKVNKELAKLLEKNGLNVNNEAHGMEHSIEVQLPFLQFASKDYIKALKIVPIMIANFNYKEIAEKINNAIKEYKKDVCFIASSDFTHFGMAYGFMPFTKDVKENLKKLDTGAIKFIQNLDPEGFLNYCEETRATICGKYPIAVLLQVLKDKAKKVQLLQYYSSGDVVGDYSNAVGYASMVFK